MIFSLSRQIRVFQILEDFNIRFADVAKPNGLITKFPAYSEHVKAAEMQQFKSGYDGVTGWPVDIEAFLMFVKLFVARKRKSVPTESILPFSLAMDKFVQHSEVNFLH